MKTKSFFRAFAIATVALIVANLFLTGCETKTENLTTATLLADDTSGGTGSTVNPPADDTLGGSGTGNPPANDGGGCAEGTICDNENNWDDGGDNEWNNDGGGCAEGTTCDNDNQWFDFGPNGEGGGQGDCFGEGNEDCREKALKADYRDIERMQREIKRFIKENKDNEEVQSELETLLSTLDGLKTKLDSVTSQDEVDSTREEIWAVQSKLDTYRMATEIERMNKEIERMEKQKEKDNEYLLDIKDTLSAEWQEKIDTFLGNQEEIISLMNEMIAKMQAGEDWSVLDEIRWKIDDVRWEMDDFWMEFEEVKTLTWATQMFDEVEKSIEEFKNGLYLELTGEKKEVADEIIEIAGTLVSEGRTALEAGDTEKINEIQWKLDELRMKGEKVFGKSRPKLQEMGFSEDLDKNFEKFTGNMSYEKMVEVVKNILAANPEILEQILLGDPMLAEKTLKIFDKVPESMQADYLNAKAELESVYQEAVDKNSSLGEYKGEILGYNYFGDALDALVSYLGEVRDGTMSVEDLLGKLNELKDESKQAKYENKIVSFNDYDDNDWYYDSVEGMTDFLKGKKTEDGGYKFAGGDNITFAETLKIVLEKFGKGQEDGVPSYSSAQNHWAKGYYVKAEEMGLTLLDPDKLITRGEMARLIVEVTLGSPESYSQSSFGDLNTSDPYFNDLETLHTYGIINGDSDTGNVRSGDPINRAETAKIINTAYEKLQFDTLNTGDLDYILETDFDVKIDVKVDGGDNNNDNYNDNDNNGGNGLDEQDMNEFENIMEGLMGMIKNVV